MTEAAVLTSGTPAAPRTGSRMGVTGWRVIRWTGLAAIVSGILFMAIQPIHPPDVLASVTTGPWFVIETLKMTMAMFGLLGVAGIYARQVNQAGWLGLVGYLLFSLFLVITVAFAFAEAFIFPLLASDAPLVVDGLLGLATGTASEVDLGPITIMYALAGAGYLLGSLAFGIATYRAGVLPRWAGALFAISGPASALAVVLLPHAIERFAAAPGGIALAWLGYALWSERREHISDPGTAAVAPAVPAAAAVPSGQGA